MSKSVVDVAMVGVAVETRLDPEGDLSPMPSLPRVGLDLTLDGASDRVAWYGRGPGESYVDSTEAARLGRYERSVGELDTPYVRPQEATEPTRGGRRSRRPGRQRPRDGGGAVRLRRPPLHHRRPGGRRPPAELPRRDDVYVSVDHAHGGLGSSSCGPATLERYRVPVEPTTFAFPFRPVDAADGV